MGEGGLLLRLFLSVCRRNSSALGVDWRGAAQVLRELWVAMGKHSLSLSSCSAGDSLFPVPVHPASCGPALAFTPAHCHTLPHLHAHVHSRLEAHFQAADTSDPTPHAVYSSLCVLSLGRRARARSAGGAA